ncbi:MAG: hypothetical protein GXY92_00795 [Syntrophomonadaceae bacterium]|nr:hypothetical protein [Syntrophomonadaceae bacterium]
MSLFLIAIAFACIGVYEAIPLLREEAWPELITAGCIWFLGFTLSVLTALKVPLPSPVIIMDLVSDVVLGMLRLVF